MQILDSRGNQYLPCYFVMTGVNNRKAISHNPLICLVDLFNSHMAKNQSQSWRAIDQKLHRRSFDCVWRFMFDVSGYRSCWYSRITVCSSVTNDFVFFQEWVLILFLMSICRVCNTTCASRWPLRRRGASQNTPPSGRILSPLPTQCLRIHSVFNVMKVI